jgi:electron transport complex protein RnfE
MNQWKNFSKGFLKESPTFIIVLGTCPTLAVTSSASNALGMGLATTFVLAGSNMVISMVKNQIPDKVRIPAYVVIIAAFVTVVELVMKAYTPALSKSLGIFIPLIVVNCIVLGRAEAFANKNNVISSIIDGVGMGLGFTFALLILGSIREFLGNGSVFNMRIYPENFVTLLFVLAPGAFIVYGYVMAVVQKINKSKKQLP